MAIELVSTAPFLAPNQETLVIDIGLGKKIERALQKLVRSVDPKTAAVANTDPNAVDHVNLSTNPNADQLQALTRELGIVALNLKHYGYELARALGGSAMSHVPPEPPRQKLGWRPSTQADIESDWCAYWCNELGTKPIYHRKMWELAYILHNLWYHDVIKAGQKGVGFGCGQEPIPSYLAAKGVQILATDLAPDHEDAKAWRNTSQHTEDLEKIWQPHLTSRDSFDSNVSLRYVDMNNIPNDIRDFDFCWSICALEHLGSIEHGMKFVENSLNVLRPGGVSVHTTEFNFTKGPTIDNWPTVLFQRENFEELANDLRSKGHQVDPISFDIGQGCLDRFIDLPPYWNLPDSMKGYEEFPAHIKLSVDGFASTCYGLVIRKAL
jgi:SAM-dependent methyltransferase